MEVILVADGFWTVVVGLLLLGLVGATVGCGVGVAVTTGVAVA